MVKKKERKEERRIDIIVLSVVSLEGFVGGTLVFSVSFEENVVDLKTALFSVQIKDLKARVIVTRYTSPYKSFLNELRLYELLKKSLM